MNCNEDFNLPITSVPTEQRAPVNTIIYQRGERPWWRRKIMVVWILWLKDI